MYDIDASESDYSDDYSDDYEYTSLEPVHLEYSNNGDVEESPEEKLMMCIDNGDLEGVKKILPEMLEVLETPQICNNKKNEVSESGDGPSESSDDEKCEDEDEDDDEDNTSAQLQIKMKEVFLKNGITPLMAAAASARSDLVEYILSLGVDVNYNIINSNNCALLSVASNICVGWRYVNNSWRIEAPKCLKMLIDAGANVKVKGYLNSQESGFTALHYAAQSNYWEMLDLLIQAGADVNAMSNQKETALMLAASRGFVTCCNILLLAGANADVTDRNGSTAAYLAGVEGHQILSDAISVYSGSAQHNVDLYKIWNQYTHRKDVPDQFNQSSSDIVDNMSNTCIESFCLSLNAPYLVPIMKDQGVTISDLKLMNTCRLKEIGVPVEDCDKIISAMQDINKNIEVHTSKISFEYGRPLKMVKVLEMVGNISEHTELLDTNLECWYSHLTKKCQPDIVLHKRTIRRLQEASLKCVQRSKSFIEQLQQLKAVCDQKNENDCMIKSNGNGNVNHTEARYIPPQRKMSFSALIAVATSVIVVTATIVFISRKSR